MSQPSDAILLWGRDENVEPDTDEPKLEPSIHTINHWLALNSKAHDREGEIFHLLPEECANGYVSAENIYVGSFNFFAPDELLAFLRTLDWQEPENVQLLVRDFNSTTFEIFTLHDYPEDQTPDLNISAAQFNGQLVAFDGTLTLLSRAQWGEIIEQSGGHVTYSVTSRTTLVIGGINCDQEWNKAHRLGIKTIWEHQLHAQLAR